MMTEAMSQGDRGDGLRAVSGGGGSVYRPGLPPPPVMAHEHTVTSCRTVRRGAAANRPERNSPAGRRPTFQSGTAGHLSHTRCGEPDWL